MKSAVAILSQKNQDDEYFSRLKLGIEVFLKQDLDFIVLLSESCNEKNKKFILEHGIDEDKILSEPRSKDTIGEAYFLKSGILTAFQIEEVHIVTSDYHMYYRVRTIFDFLLSNVYSVSYHITQTDKMRRRESILNQLNSLKYFIDIIEKCQDEALLLENHLLYKAAGIERKNDR